MATSAQQAMEKVEHRRSQLEENVSKLRKALQHWSAWETEYEMLKEELHAAGSPSPSEMLEIGRSLGGTLVDEKEVTELLGKDLQTKRTANQVVDMISRRIDYVQQNRSTVEKQLNTAEKQLAGASLLLDPGLENEEGLPMLDIEEELDDEENVVSSSVTQPGKVAPELMEALRKAGLHKSEQNGSHEPNESKRSSTGSVSQAPVVPSTSASASTPSKLAADPSVVNDATQATDVLKLEGGTKSKVSDAPPQKKSVSFSDDVKVETFEKPNSLKDDLKNWNLKPGARVYELDEEGNIANTAIVPPDESIEDAQLRREMLQYGLSEVGQVVAELDLDEDEDEDEDLDDYEEDSDESEEEDEYGRSTGRLLTDEYRQQMMELEKRLNARMMENVGPRPDLHPLSENADDVRRLRVRKDEEFNSLLDTSEDTPVDASEKKGVRFADKLDIADAPDPQEDVRTHPLSSSSRSTISDIVVERAPTVPQAPAAPSKPAKVSRFKSARASAGQAPRVLPTPAVPEPPPVPTGPAGRTLASTIIEHDGIQVEPQAPDELDPVLINREIQTEYHRLRNKIIQRQGGFTASDQVDDDGLIEERDGRTKKVSRFKAARLKAEGL